MLLERRVDPVTKLVVGARGVAARPDDPEVLGHEAFTVEVEETGEQLARESRFDPVAIDPSSKLQSWSTEQNHAVSV